MKLVRPSFCRRRGVPESKLVPEIFLSVKLKEKIGIARLRRRGVARPVDNHFRAKALVAPKEVSEIMCEKESVVVAFFSGKKTEIFRRSRFGFVRSF